MSIFEDIRKGTLTGAKLNTWLKSNSTILSDEEPSSGRTPLAVAVVSGFPTQVDQLLRKGAKADRRSKNGETPLLLAAWKASRERPLIVQKLLTRVPPESIDDTCEIADNNTPLMYAIKNNDVETIRILRKAGASLLVKNNDGFNAEELAQNTKKESTVRALYPKKEQTDLARLASIILSFILNVVAWVNTNLNGAVRRVFGLTGELDQGINQQINRDPEEPTPDKYLEDVDVFVREHPVLDTFFKNKKDFIQDLTRKSVDLANDPNTDLGCPDLLPKTTKVTLHQQVLYCDDSTSMVNKKGQAEERWRWQKELALRITQTTTRILPDDEGVVLQFINEKSDSSTSLDLKGIREKIDSTIPKGDTPIGTALREKILQPLVYNNLPDRTLARPLLISIITDGGPSKEDDDTLAKVIVECGEMLTNAGFPLDSVKFLIGQVGSADKAVKFLDSLRDNAAVKQVSYIFPGRLDEKYKELRDERSLDRWLIETLFEPLAISDA